MIYKFKKIESLLLSLAFITIVSCDNNKMLLKQINVLKKEKDSLSKVLEDIDNKYVFDSIFLKTIPNHKNSFDLNSNYEMDIILVAYGSNSNYFIEYDSIVGNKRVNPDTLKHKNGTFKFRTELNNKLNPISINVNIDNKYGKSIKGTLSDLIKTK